MEVRNKFFIIKMKQLNTYSSNIVSPDLHGQSSKLLQPYFCHVVLLIFVGISLMESIIGLKSILGWEQLRLFGRYGYVKMIKCLTIKTLLFCRLSIWTSVLSIYGHLYKGWRIVTFIWRSVHDWRLQLGIFFF
jgi:hypothetical protein